jgi:hypothetical protein
MGGEPDESLHGLRAGADGVGGNIGSIQSHLALLGPPKKQQAKNLESKIEICGALTGTPSGPAADMIPNPFPELCPHVIGNQTCENR